MTKQFTVLLDLDSTIYDLWTPWLKWYNTQYEDFLTTHDIDCWDWHIKAGCGAKVYDFLSIKGVFNSLKPFPGALEAIKLVNSWGSVKQVFVSTITGTTGSAEKKCTINRDFPYLGARSLVLVGGDKSLVRGDVLVDDGAHNLKDFKAVGGLTIMADMHCAPYCFFQGADAVLSDWRDYPGIIENLWRENFG